MINFITSVDDAFTTVICSVGTINKFPDHAYECGKYTAPFCIIV